MSSYYRNNTFRKLIHYVIYLSHSVNI